MVNKTENQRNFQTKINNYQHFENVLISSQNRIKREIKKGFKFQHLTCALSNRILRNHISKRVSMAVMFIDLVESTKISIEISPKQLPNVIRGFSQEATFVVESYGGHVLKFVGDAVLAYFLIENFNNDSSKTVKNALNSAFAFMYVVENGLNSLFETYNLPRLGLHIGIDYGKNNVVLYGANKLRSHIDLIGPTINLAAKMASISGKNEIVIGERVFTKINSNSRKKFKKITDLNRWKYQIEHNKNKSSLYSVYEGPLQ
ncbi:MAG TPA: adenylate/guanylate cyclase domain-containing protein [Nitrososphaeraceae archaeon]|nr:adenylate/guanylate cyclase domain-containing protein [Nitrososphaeraceae archaeon]